MLEVNLHDWTPVQWFGQKSCGDSAVRSEFVIAGMIFHPSRVKSELLRQYIEQSFVALTLLPACHREDVWRLARLDTPFLGTYEIERCQRGVKMKIGSSPSLRPVSAFDSKGLRAAY
jgi:hypothetical protein